MPTEKLAPWQTASATLRANTAAVALAAIVLIGSAIACDSQRRFGNGVGDPNAKLARSGGFYGDGDTTSGALPTWDTISSSFGGKPIASDGAATAGGPAQSLPCGGATAKPDNSCCPSGQAWHIGLNACAAATLLPECTSVLTCVPQWCADWLTADGAPCLASTPLCRNTPRQCSAADIGAASCGSGLVPSALAGKSTCVAAGSEVQLPSGVLVPAEGKLPPVPLVGQLVAADLVAVNVPPPALTTPNWCFASSNVASACPAYAGACAVGTVVDPVAKAGCVPLAAVLPPWCPDGFTAVGGAVPQCVADAAECGSDPFGGVAEDGKNVFVDAGYTGQAPPKGTKAAPLTTLADALAKLKGASTEAGAIIVLAAGNYVLAAGISEIASGVTVRGRCASTTHLIGSSASGAAASIEVAGVLERVTVNGGLIPVVVKGQGKLVRSKVQNGSYAGIRLLSGTIEKVVVHGLGRGVLADGKGGTGAILGLRISNAKEQGMVVAGGFVATVAGLVVTGTLPADSGSGGYGLLAAEAAKVNLTGARLHANTAAGVAVFDLATEMTLTVAAITNTNPAAKDKTAGHGVLATSAGKLVLNHAILEQNHAIGLLAFGAGSQINAVNVSVIGTLPQAADSGLGDGIRAQNGGSVQAFGVVVQNNRHFGALCSGIGTKLGLAQALIAQTQAQLKDNSGGEGLWVESGCQANLGDVRIDASRSAGMVVVGKGTKVDAISLVITGTLAQESTKLKGFGIQIVEGAQVAAGLLHVDGARTAAVWVADTGSALVLNALKAVRTLPQSDSFGGRGIHVTGGAKVLVNGMVFLYENRDLAVLADGAGTQVVLGNGQDPVIIANTLPRADGWTGRAIQAQDGAHVSLLRAHLTGGSEAGLVATGKDTLVTAKQVVVTAVSPRQLDGRYGRGVVVEKGATLTAPGLVVAGCTDAGVFVHGASVSGSDWTIAHIQSGPKMVATGDLGAGGLHGRGLVAQGGAQVQVQRLRVSQASEVAVSAAGSPTAATVVRLADLVVDATLPEAATQEAGRAIDLSAGATVYVAGGWLAGNRDAAIHLSGGGARLYGYNLAIVDTKGDAATDRRGRGIVVSDTASLMLTGSRLLKNRQVGILVQGATALLGGVLVQDTTADASGAAGWGVAAQWAATIEAFGLRAAGNHGAAVAVWAAKWVGDRVVLVDTLVSQTRTRNGTVAGETADGLHAVAEATLVVSRLLIASAKRVAVLIDASVATLSHSQISSSGFGWAVQNGGGVFTDNVAMVDNEQNVWTGPALSTLQPLEVHLPRPQLEPLTY
ncbi:MAG: hypothetical protein EXR77_09810 [Myxococcales bacterium]|nr:hypothetical protein [Myxococcales bacterium]